MKNNISIRMATPKDAQAILDIYAPYIKNTSFTFEYEVPTVEEFSSRIENTLLKYPYLVAEEQGEILGYCYAGPYKGRAAYDWSAECTVYVKQDNKKSGIGRILYTELESFLQKQNIINVYACITYPNPDSIRFHEQMEYQKVSHLNKCGYKLGRWYDVIWMEKFLCEHPQHPEPFKQINLI